MQTNDIPPVVEGATLTSGLLLLEHVILWDTRDRLPLTARYTLGTAAIGAGVTWAAFRRQELLPALTFWCIAGAGGALVVTAHWLRAQSEQPVDRLLRRALGGESNGLWRTPPGRDR
jgi:hypothetical protein